MNQDSPPTESTMNRTRRIRALTQLASTLSEQVIRLQHELQEELESTETMEREAFAARASLAAIRTLTEALPRNQQVNHDEVARLSFLLGAHHPDGLYVSATTLHGLLSAHTYLEAADRALKALAAKASPRTHKDDPTHD